MLLNVVIEGIMEILVNLVISYFCQQSSHETKEVSSQDHKKM